MSNKRKRPQNSGQPKANQAATKKPNRNEQKAKRPMLFVWLAALIVVVIAAAGFFLLLNQPTASPNSTAAKVAQPKRVGETDCPVEPSFVQKEHFSTGTAFSTSERGVLGLALVRNDPNNPNGQNLIYQEPSWKIAGNLATIVIGKNGEVFTAPAPSINVLYNPVSQQNEIYRVDPNSGVMAHFLSLPQAAAGSPENPFGVLGLAYDCEINRLYASSVAGSTLNQQVGRIYAVDTSKVSQLDELDNLDALGLGVFDGAQGKRLYFGLARLPEIWSIGLDANGKFEGKPRFEFSLANLGPRGSDKARKIEFNGQNQMVVHGIEFSFNLIAPTEKQETIYTFNYDQTKDSWSFVSAQNNATS